PLAPASPEPSASATLWLLSVWTRKAAKNWPLEHWDLLLQQLLDQGVECAVLLAPDGDEAFAQFRARWEGRVGFVSGSLGQIADTVRTVAGVIATDNFLGHMAGYYGKPVVWINMVSPAAQVMPRGPRTIEVAPERVGPGEAAGAAGMAIVTVEAVRRAFDAARAPG
ncbi:MAG TPA: glycosyltransferase family 9 protein, partial [Fibrobacteria bacterium]|nr:glycosyltransferase family 9 protein [Fibrobacteria bacterium]